MDQEMNRVVKDPLLAHLNVCSNNIYYICITKIINKMKKLFISVVALAMSMMAMAAETAYVQIRLTGITGGVSNSVYLTEDDAYTNAYESGADAEKIMDLANSNSVLMYGFVGTLPCGDVVALNLDGFALGFTTNMVDNEYKLTFKNVSGRELTLYDRVENSQTIITNNGTYNFEVDASLVGQKQVNDRFYINMDPANIHTVTTNDYGFCSFASASAVTLPAGLKAYKGAFEISDYSIALSYIGQVVPANEGVILWTPEEISKEFAYVVGGSAPAVSGNSFVGAVVAKPVDEIVAAAIYCLHGNELMKYVGTEDIPAGKAYLPVSASSSAPQRIRMVFHETEQTEAVSNVEATVKAVKFVENGQIYIRRGNEVFNLQGQIVK